ncbi:hypothetical protein P9112_006672 [Eukaryota sp. TZLM1-RC]
MSCPSCDSLRATLRFTQRTMSPGPHTAFTLNSSVYSEDPAMDKSSLIIAEQQAIIAKLADEVDHLKLELKKATTVAETPPPSPRPLSSSTSSILPSTPTSTRLSSLALRTLNTTYSEDICETFPVPSICHSCQQKDRELALADEEISRLRSELACRDAEIRRLLNANRS